MRFLPSSILFGLYLLAFKGTVEGGPITLANAANEKVGTKETLNAEENGTEHEKTNGGSTGADSLINDGYVRQLLNLENDDGTSKCESDITIIRKIAESMVSQSPVIPNEVEPGYWEDLARRRFKKDCELFDSLQNSPKAKNVVLLLGDGMGLPTIAASRFYSAQVDDRYGSMDKHPCENWPFNTMARTYDLESSTTDSAASATAYLTGTKTRTGMIGVTGKINLLQCGPWDAEQFLETTLEAAHNAGKATGVMTNTRITHASPSGAYGHVSFREMENDMKIREFCPTSYVNMTCADLACQLINNHTGINVIIGGGQKYFYTSDERIPFDNLTHGTRLDGRHLAQEWIRNRTEKGQRFCTIFNPHDIKSSNCSASDYVLGLPYPDTLPYVQQLGNEPNLLQYVKIALEVLKRQANGFFLFIESGRIDHAHHMDEPHRALVEMKHFDEIMEYVQENVNLSETLVIVTADHSHSFELVGHMGRFQNILGLDQSFSNFTNDETPMTGINYVSGPNGMNGTSRKDPRKMNLSAWDSKFPTMIPLPIASHGGEDVGVYAIGPMSEIFHKTIDNTMIAQGMKFAMGLAPYTNEKSEKPCDCLDSTFT